MRIEQKVDAMRDEIAAIRKTLSAPVSDVIHFCNQSPCPCDTAKRQVDDRLRDRVKLYLREQELSRTLAATQQNLQLAEAGCRCGVSCLW